MKKRYVIISLLAAFLSAKGQTPDSSYVKKKLSTKDVAVMMSYYTQDNDHSAVTGGKGTEDLQVFALGVTYDWKKDSVRNIQWDIGVDIISSASTDKIDFVVSSASKDDARTHVGLGYGKFFKNNFAGSANAMISVESDYTSANLGLQIGHVSEDRAREWSVNIQTFFDDLRWGRFENGRPQKLIYPQELRSVEWFKIHNRNSYNIELGWYQTINKRTAIGFSPAIVFQKGLMSTRVKS